MTTLHRKFDRAAGGKQSHRGFTLAEIVIAVVVLGVVITPFALYLARLPVWQHRLNEQSRLEAGRTWQDQALASGIDAEKAAMAQTALNAAAPQGPRPSLERETPAPPAEGISVLSLRLRPAAGTVAEPRPVGAGWQLGAGAATTPIPLPDSPLPPQQLPSPTITPEPGHVWTVAELQRGATSADPWVGVVAARTAADRIVRLEFQSPAGLVSGLGSAFQTVNAADLVQGVAGRAWVEYAGQEDAGDRAEVLADGRRRWLVEREGQRCTIEPSPWVTFAYRIALPEPVLRFGAGEVPSGGEAAIDYAAFLAVQEGRAPLRLAWSESAKLPWGQRWSEGWFGFTCTLGGVAGPRDGNLAPLCTTAAATAWTDRLLITTQVASSPTVVSVGGSWTLVRRKLRLGEPELAQHPGGGADAYLPGQFGFVAPLEPTLGQRVGRLSARNESLLSSGSELSLAILP